MKLEYSAKMQVSVSGKVQGEIPLAPVSFSPVPGVNVKFTPAYIVEVSAKIDLKGELSGCIGFSASTENGTKDLTSKPSFNAAVKLEGKVFIGLQLEPEIEIGVEVKKIIKLILAEASIKSRIGVEITASMKKEAGKKEAVKLHECKNCLEGKFVGKYELSFEVKFLSDHIKSEFKLFNFSEPITDFYYSFDFNEFAFTRCPHCQYKVSILVRDSNGNPVNEAVVNDQYHTDENGKTSFFLPDGEYGITVKKDGNTIMRKITIQGEAQSIMIDLGFDGSSDESGSLRVKYVCFDMNTSAAIMEDGSLYMWGGMINKHQTIPVKVLNDVKQVDMCGGIFSAITKSGSLYLWGYNYHGELGNGTLEMSYVPTKILDNVQTFNSNGDSCGTITKDGVLYMWGYNGWGELGDGTTEDKWYPIKVMDNVELQSFGTYSSLITREGVLYIWGRGKLFPIKILDDVKIFNDDNATYGAIRKNDSLYMWGNNSLGQIGNGTREDSLIPVKILDNVNNFSMTYRSSAAIVKDGSLYMWGDNDSGQLGNGTMTSSLTPIKIMENVKMISQSGTASAAITNDGSLYMWGAYNRWTKTGSLIPVKILDNVDYFDFHGGVRVAIQENGSLYTWGEAGNNGNSANCMLGNGTSSGSLNPVKILDNVVSIHIGGYNMGAITKDGSLYTWGKMIMDS